MLRLFYLYLPLESPSINPSLFKKALHGLLLRAHIGLIASSNCSQVLLSKETRNHKFKFLLYHLGK